MKTAIVCGAGGFIGHHLVKRLKKEGYWVRGIDIKYPEFEQTEADQFVILDLAGIQQAVQNAFVDPHKSGMVTDLGFDEVYNLAAWMGGAGVIFTGDNDAKIMMTNISINTHVLEACRNLGVKRLFFTSSACMYPKYNQEDPNNPKCSEHSAYPAFPDSEYGWEKLFTERLYLAYVKNYGMEIRIARLHNIFGPLGSWKNGKEKVPAALCRKIAMADAEIEMWGDGLQTRSFLYIDDCIDGIIKLMQSDVKEPLNIGSEEMVSINQLAKMIMGIAKKNLTIKHISGPVGVRGRNSDNTLCKEKLGWEPKGTLYQGLLKTYEWIEKQVKIS